MRVLNARNVNEAFRLGMMELNRGRSIQRPSRAGPVIEADGPVTTIYNHPDERVLTIQERDANPFFHFFEALWMLHGDEDLEFLSWFNSRMHEFSDDGKIFHGAYGHRWRKHWGKDQLEICIQMLIDDTDTRRAVLTMWDPAIDLMGTPSVDIPCNDIIFFKRNINYLRMTICCRSNDAIWGAYGANAVHLSMLMEYVARRVGIELGEMVQVSDSLHVYVNNPQWSALRNTPITGYCPYNDEDIWAYPMMDAGGEEYWDRDLDVFMKWIRSEWNRDDFDGAPDYPYANSFFRAVAEPMAVTFKLHTSKASGGGLAMVNEIEASDWRYACVQWLEKRETPQ